MEEAGEEDGEDQIEDHGNQHLGLLHGEMNVVQHGNNREEVEGEGDHLVRGLTREVLGAVSMDGTVTVEDMEHMSLTVLIVGGGEGIRGSGGEVIAGQIKGEGSE